MHFSEYVALLDDVERIPLEARQSPTLSTEERAVVVGRVVEFVRNDVLPQSDREEEGLEALFYSVVAIADDQARSRRTRDHDAIVERVDELASADPGDAGRVREHLYRLHAAIAGHFGEAELMVASASDEGSPPIARRSEPISGWPSAGTAEGEYAPSPWFG